MIKLFSWIMFPFPKPLFNGISIKQDHYSIVLDYLMAIAIILFFIPNDLQIILSWFQDQRLWAENGGRHKCPDASCHQWDIWDKEATDARRHQWDQEAADGNNHKCHRCHHSHLIFMVKVPPLPSSPSPWRPGCFELPLLWNHFLLSISCWQIIAKL